jgi:hypothetical protein
VVLTKKLLQQNQNLFLLDCAGSKLADQQVFVLSNTALNIRSWIVSSKVHLNFDILSILTGVSLVVTGTESKSVSLGLPRFETCPMTSLFLSEHALIVDS